VPEVVHPTQLDPRGARAPAVPKSPAHPYLDDSFWQEVWLSSPSLHVMSWGSVARGRAIAPSSPTPLLSPTPHDLFSSQIMKVVGTLLLIPKVNKQRKKTPPRLLG
jgi:hypothetical protein